MLVGSKHTPEAKAKMSKWQRSKTLSPEHRRKIGTASRGRIATPETRAKISAAAKLRTGTKNPFFGKSHSPEAVAIIRAKNKGKKMSPEFCKNQSERMKGSNNPRWNGNYPESLRLRRSKQYLEWRLAVFTRDNFSCVECKDNRGGNLQADHLKPWATHPELRFEVENGRTLCIPCHKKTDTWGTKTRAPKARECVYLMLPHRSSPE